MFRQLVKSIEYDPNRTANIALICYADGEKAYILAPEGLKVGQKVMNGPEGRNPCRKLLAVRTYPGWYYGSQHRASPRKGRPDGSFCRKRRSADG